MILNSKKTISESLDRSIVANFSVPNLSAQTSLNFTNQTTLLTNDFAEKIARLTERRYELQAKVDSNPVPNDNYRKNGIDLAWDYERLEVSMGGRGSRNYTPEQIDELLATGKVEGMEGHHINNVASRPDLQGNPDNIKMVTHGEHMVEHGNNTANPTSGELIERELNLNKLNREQVLKNDMVGLGISAAIGFGTGFAISIIMELAMNGAFVKTKTKTLLKKSVFTGFETATISSVTYVVGRGASELLGCLDIPSLIANSIEIGTIGMLSAAIVSTYQYVKLRLNGVEKEDAFDVIGKQISISLLGVTTVSIATGIWGGPVGTLVSVGTSVIYIGANIAKNIHERKFNENLREYMVEQYKPIYIEF